MTEKEAIDQGIGDIRYWRYAIQKCFFDNVSYTVDDVPFSACSDKIEFFFEILDPCIDLTAYKFMGYKAD